MGEELTMFEGGLARAQSDVWLLVVDSKLLLAACECCVDVLMGRGGCDG